MKCDPHNKPENYKIEYDKKIKAEVVKCSICGKYIGRPQK